ncbi:hypothetical protein [Nonomuraea africana]|uniref:hypothetical protein n=1 Tax=Nonomuraea africana TaxID=46171 RepID=UPI001CEF05E4|nr:hypothetical protein [Nonomuraea africana]
MMRRPTWSAERERDGTRPGEGADTWVENPTSQARRRLHKEAGNVRLSDDGRDIYVARKIILQGYKGRFPAIWQIAMLVQIESFHGGIEQ